MRTPNATALDASVLKCVAPLSPTDGAEACVGQPVEIDMVGNGHFTRNGVAVKRVTKPTILALQPTRQFRTGGLVTLMGNSFVNTPYLKCKFFTHPDRGLDDEQITSQVTFVNMSTVICRQPPFPAGVYLLCGGLRG